MSGWWWLRMGAWLGWLEVGGEPRLTEGNVRSTVWRFCFGRRVSGCFNVASMVL